jgi:uncharacterized protein YjbI with pentapeptide repeats
VIAQPQAHSHLLGAEAPRANLGRLALEGYPSYAQCPWLYFGGDNWTADMGAADLDAADIGAADIGAADIDGADIDAADTDADKCPWLYFGGDICICTVAS